MVYNRLLNRVWSLPSCGGLSKRVYVVVAARNTNDVQDIVANYPQTSLVVKLDVTIADQIKAAVVATIAKLKKNIMTMQYN